MADLSLQHIYKRYPGNITAVSDFCLEIEDKEFVVLVGPSGCGKSTILRMIAGLEDISEGDILIGGIRVNDTAPKDRDVAMVFQNYALYPHMTVFDNMAFGLKMGKTPIEEIKRRVVEAAGILDISHLLDRKPKALSGGQRQRVALGRAIVREPKVFLLDEPLSNLDAKLHAQMRTELLRLHQRLGTTFIYVTHDQIEAMTMGDRIVVMRDGVIQQVDKPQTVYDKPCNIFVAGFIGLPKMNFLTAVLSCREEGAYVRIGGVNGKEVRIPEGRFKPEQLKPYDGKAVQLGIRPENIHYNEGEPPAEGGNIFEARVDVTEMIGAETYLYLDMGEQTLTARALTQNSAKSGSRVRVEFEMDKIHLFDKDTEKSIMI